eukprot:527397-Pleurochrysis_carterae.AAC.1
MLRDHAGNVGEGHRRRSGVCRTGFPRVMTKFRHQSNSEARRRSDGESHSQRREARTEAEDENRR